MYLNHLGDALTDMASGGITALATGSAPPIKFNSTKYPGTCKPSDPSTYEVFREMQRQLNRLAKARGKSVIAVDGDVGPGTVGLVSQLGPFYGQAGGVLASSTCSIIATNARAITYSAKGQADMFKIPATVPSPKPVKPPTLVDNIGGEIPAPPDGMSANVLKAWDGLGTVGKVAAVGILAGIGYFLTKKKGR